MPILNFRQIIIDLVDRPDFPIPRQTDFPAFTRHFVNIGLADSPEFELREASSPTYRLSAAENNTLLQCMGFVTFSALCPPLIGRDGTACELLIRQHGWDISFRWHLQLPEQWESVGALFDYAAAVHTRPDNDPEPASAR